MGDKENIVDKINNDDNKIVITTGSVKWILGILGGAIVGILGFAYGLYTTTQTDIETNATADAKSKAEIIQMIADLKEEDVKLNTKINNSQNVDIGRLYERTDSRNNVNTGVERPINLDGPSIH